jgi:hypothetical protein
MSLEKLGICILAVGPLLAVEPRPMSTDRPDTTESPHTVPAGWFQLEASLLDYSHDANRGTRSTQWIFGQINLKHGLDESTDLQCIVNSHAVAGVSELGDGSRTSGFGDLTLRLKRNLLGNDDDGPAFAVMPYLTIPTHTQVSDNAWGGGLILPFGMALGQRLSLGLMAEMDVVPDTQSGGHDLEWLHSATLGLALSERFGVYFELVAIAGEDAAFQGLGNGGMTYSYSANLVFDVGMRLGLNAAAPDVGVFSGVSFRF